MRIFIVWTAVTAMVLGCGDDTSESRRSDAPDSGDECTQGNEGCECFANGTCNGDLSCLSELCVDATGIEGGGSGGTAGGSAGTGDPDGGTEPANGGDGGTSAGGPDGGLDSGTGGDGGAAEAGETSFDAAAGDGDAGEEVPATAHCEPVSDWDPGWAQKEAEVLSLINQHRARGADCGTEGVFPPVPPLRMNPHLRCAARLHSMDMATQDYFSGQSLDGRNVADRMSDAGYEAGYWLENINSGFSNASSVVDSWMGVDSICSGIMNSAPTECGVGFYEESGSDGSPIRRWTHDFASPSGS